MKVNFLWFVVLMTMITNCSIDKESSTSDPKIWGDKTNLQETADILTDNINNNINYIINNNIYPSCTNVKDANLIIDYDNSSSFRYFCLHKITDKSKPNVTKDCLQYKGSSKPYDVAILKSRYSDLADKCLVHYGDENDVYSGRNCADNYPFIGYDTVQEDYLDGNAETAQYVLDYYFHFMLPPGNVTDSEAGQEVTKNLTECEDGMCLPLKDLDNYDANSNYYIKYHCHVEHEDRPYSTDSIEPTSEEDINL